VNEKFESIGMESLYFINNVGSFFLALLFEVSLIPIWLIILVLGRYIKFFRK